MSQVDPSAFAPTHSVPAEGMATYGKPEPPAVPGPWLDAHLEVQVLEQRDDGWAQVAFSNGWTAWADGRLLRPIRRYVPASGMVTFAAADARLSPGARVDAGVEVTVAEHHPDGWARIVCSNGWTAWVDGRLLLAAAPTGTGIGVPPMTAQAAAYVPSYGQSAQAGGRYSGPGYAGSVTAGTADELYTRWLPLLAGGLVLLGAFLPWFRVVGTSVSPWKVSFLYLFYADTDAQPHIGLVLLLPAAMIIGYSLVPLLGGQALPRRVLFIGAALAAELSTLSVQRLLHHDVGIGLHVGPFVVLAGGIVAYVCHWRTRPVGRPGRWSWI